MDGARAARGVAATEGIASGLHSRRISVEQRVHFAALLIALACALPLQAQDVVFDPATTQADFQKFSRIVGQAIFATPVEPARSSGILGFNVGVAVTALKIDQGSSYWSRAVPANSDFTRNGYILVPRLVATKGFGSGTISGTYAKLQNSGIKTWGGALDVPIIRGTLATPEIAFRASYSTLSGVDVFREKTYGAEVFSARGSARSRRMRRSGGCVPTATARSRRRAGPRRSRSTTPATSIATPSASASRC
jgi:hypothetical protein